MQNNKIYMVVVFAISHTHTKENSLVASIFYSKNEINTKYYNDYISRNLPIGSKHKAQFDIKKKTHIVRVLSSGQLLNKLNSIRDNECEADNVNFTKEQHLNYIDLLKYKIYKSVTPSTYFNYYEIYDYNFFTPLFIQNYIFSRRINLLEHVFIFDTLDWKKLVYCFKVFNMPLSGGSTVKRHALSPVQISLSRFIIATTGLQNTYPTSRDSFNLSSKFNLNFLVKNFSRDKRIWLIREAVRLSPFMNQHYDQMSLLLYYVSQSKPTVIDFIFDKLANLWYDDGLYKLLLSNIEDIGYQPNDYLGDKILKPLYSFDLIYHPLEKRFTSWELLNQELEKTKIELKQSIIADLSKKSTVKESQE